MWRIKVEEVSGRRSCVAWLQFTKIVSSYIKNINKNIISIQTN